MARILTLLVCIVTCLLFISSIYAANREENNARQPASRSRLTDVASSSRSNANTSNNQRLITAAYSNANADATKGISAAKAQEVFGILVDKIFFSLDPLEPDDMLRKLEEADSFMNYLRRIGMEYPQINHEKISWLLYLAHPTGCARYEMIMRRNITQHLKNLRQSRFDNYIEHFNKIQYENCIDLVKNIIQQRLYESTVFRMDESNKRDLVRQVQLALPGLDLNSIFVEGPLEEIFLGAYNYMMTKFDFDKAIGESIEGLASRFLRKIEITLRQSCKVNVHQFGNALKTIRMMMDHYPNFEPSLEARYMDWLQATNICSILIENNFEKRLLGLALEHKYHSMNVIASRLLNTTNGDIDPDQVREYLFIMANIMITRADHEDLQYMAKDLHEVSNVSIDECTYNSLRNRLQLNQFYSNKANININNYIKHYNSSQVAECLVQLDSILREEFKKLSRSDANNLKELRRVAQSRIHSSSDKESVDITTITNVMKKPSAKQLAHLSLASYLIRKGVKSTTDNAQLQTKINKYLKQTFEQLNSISYNLKKKIIILNELDSNQYGLLQPITRNHLFDIFLWDVIAFGDAINYDVLNTLLSDEQPTEYNCLNPALLCDK